MTRKEYQAIADALARAQARMETTLGNSSAAHMTAFDAADSIAREFARQNSNFNYARFMKACGFGEPS